MPYMKVRDRGTGDGSWFTGDSTPESYALSLARHKAQSEFEAARDAAPRKCWKCGVALENQAHQQRHFREAHQ